jgi:hypothetical protein
MRSVKGTLTKLRKMSFDEGYFRLRAKGTEILDRLQVQLGRAQMSEQAFMTYVSGSRQLDMPTLQSELLERKRTQAGPRFFVMEKTRAHDQAIVSTRHDGWLHECVRRAERSCARHFTLLHVNVHYEQAIQWHADPVSGQLWPQGPYYTVPIFAGDSGYGDIKYVWELNRQPFLIDIARAYWLTGNERYADVCLGMLEDWIQANPYLYGVNWSSALEIAVRSLAWLWAYFCCLHATAMTPQRHLTLLKALYQHGQYLERHLSFYFSPYNHLIGEATALYGLGLLFPELRCARRWRETGWRILGQEVAKQFYADGGTVEQTTSYHHFTLGFYLWAVILQRLNGGEIDTPMWQRLEKAMEFAMYMMQPDGTLPMIGDNDDAQAIVQEGMAPWDFRHMLSLGAVLFDRADFKRQAGPFSEAAFWLLGADGRQQYERLSTVEPHQASLALPHSGYYIMRSGWAADDHYLCFDCGALADGVFHDETPSAAHGHADALSFTLAAYGQPCLVDPGFYTYNGALEWHRYFRETAAHNTVVIDGQPQAAYRGRLKWSHAPQVTRLHWGSAAAGDYVEGMHDGYSRYTPAVLHRRAVLFCKPHYWLIRDEFSGEGEHELAWYFHFAPEACLTQEETGTVLMQHVSGTGLAVVPVERTQITVDLLPPGEAPEAGWVAPQYGMKVQAPMARYRQRARLPMTLHTLLLPYAGQGLPGTVDVVPEGTPQTAQTLLVTTQEHRDVFLFSAGHGATSCHTGWQTDGRAACVRLNDRQEVWAGFLVNGTVLTRDGQDLLRIDRPVGFAAILVQAGQTRIELSEAADVVTTLPNACIVIAPTLEGMHAQCAIPTRRRS